MDTVIVLETDVPIDHFRGIVEATADMRSLAIAQRATTDVTVMELSKGLLVHRSVPPSHDACHDLASQGFRCLMRPRIMPCQSECLKR
jgi:predicted nucleic acid-binding protein